MDKQQDSNTPPVNSRRYEDDHLSCELRDGVMMIKFKNTYIDKEVAINGIKERLKLANGGTYPTCSDIRQVKGFSKEARKVLGQGDAEKGVSAGAIIVGSAIERSIFNFFMVFSKPSIPAKIFSHESKALEWLRAYKPDQLN